MIGVVIWSCEQSQRVILWCEDSGDLAYARGPQAYVAQSGGFPGVGDVVAFLVEAEALETPGLGGVTRHARAVRVVERGAFPGVDAMLRDTAAAQSQTPTPVPTPAMPAPVLVASRPEIAATNAGAGSAGRSPRQSNLRLAATG